MKNTKILAGLAVLIIAVVSIAVLAANNSDGEIGRVDLQAAYEAHPGFMPLYQELQTEIQSLQGTFLEEAEKLQAEGREEELQHLNLEFEEQVNMLQMQFMQEIQATIQPDLEEARQKLGLKLLLSNEAVASGGEDYTDEVIDFFNDI